MKRAYIIPGYRQTAKTAGFSDIKKMFEKAGYEATIVKIDWKYNTLTDWVQQFMEQYEKGKGKTVVLGFSYGAMIAAAAQKEIKANALLLCSLSPYFKEDMPHIKDWWKKHIGKKRTADFTTYLFNMIAKTLTGKVYLVKGEAEHETLHHRVKEASKRIPQNTLHAIPEVKHDISDKRYQEKIREIISTL